MFTVADWIALAALVLGIFGGGFAAWNTLRNEIRDSRHKTMNYLQVKFESFDKDLDKLRDDLNVLAQRITRLEVRAGEAR